MLQIISETSKVLGKSRITGRLRIANKKSNPEYFYITKKGDTKGRYLKKDEMPLAQKVAQHQYEQKLLKAATRWQHALQHCLTLLPAVDLADICCNPKSRRNLIAPEILTDEEYAAHWKLEPFIQSTYAPEDKKYRTKNGEAVRSKSEKIIADMLFDAGIPYRYECSLRLNGRTIFPDFTILDLPHHQIVIWEHLGLLDEPEYAVRNHRKMVEYIKGGYLPGINLIITAETQSEPLDVQVVNLWIARL